MSFSYKVQEWGTVEAHSWIGEHLCSQQTITTLGPKTTHYFLIIVSATSPFSSRQHRSLRVDRIMMFHYLVVMAPYLVYPIMHTPSANMATHTSNTSTVPPSMVLLMTQSSHLAIRAVVHYHAVGNPVPQVTDPLLVFVPHTMASFSAVEVDPVPLWDALPVVLLASDPLVSLLPSEADPPVFLFPPVVNPQVFTFAPTENSPISRLTFLPLPDPTIVAATLTPATLSLMVHPATRPDTYPVTQPVPRLVAQEANLVMILTSAIRPVEVLQPPAGPSSGGAFGRGLTRTIDGDS